MLARRAGVTLSLDDTAGNSVRETMAAVKNVSSSASFARARQASQPATARYAPALASGDGWTDDKGGRAYVTTRPQGGDKRLHCLRRQRRDDRDPRDPGDVQETGGGRACRSRGRRPTREARPGGLLRHEPAIGALPHMASRRREISHLPCGWIRGSTGRARPRPASAWKASERPAQAHPAPRAAGAAVQRPAHGWAIRPAWPPGASRGTAGATDSHRPPRRSEPARRAWGRTGQGPDERAVPGIG